MKPQQPYGSRSDDTRWDHSTNQDFYEYYAEQSISPKTTEQLRSVQRLILGLLPNTLSSEAFDVADIGCGAGAQCILWAQSGYRVHGLDINGPLIDLGRSRSKERHLDIDFKVGSATDLPWDDNTMDVCLVPELLEHVADWKRCLNEFSRVLKPGGILYLSTTNILCPVQDEFTLPLYSWYPSSLKRYYEHLAVTTRPEIANHAKYPAVNWFTFYGLRHELAQLGLRSVDRFDVMNTKKKGYLAKLALSAIKALPPVRWLGHVVTPYTTLVAFKE